jgi:NAD(P)-dependent dehydrogenase (short-subunit alcohol dehydrogenase family)
MPAVVNAEPAMRGARVLVFGAAGGIGSELVRRLAAAGARLAIAGRNAERLEALAKEFGALALPHDARDPDAVQQAFADAATALSGIDGVAHCVGSLLLKPAHATSAAEFEETIAINLSTAFHVVSAAARVMKDGGSVVLVSTAAARVGLANHEAVAAAKAGVEGLALSAAATYAPRGLRFNCVAPGLVRTPLTARITENEASLKASLAMVPLGRIGEPKDVAAAMEWLLDPAQSWITGQIVGVDGGLARVRPRPRASA